MKFGFWFDYDQTYTFVDLYNALAQRMPQARASGFIVNDRYRTYAVEHLPPDSTLIDFYELVARGRRYRPSADEVAQFRAWDERHRLARIAYSDRHLQTWRYEELIPLYIYLIDEFRKYIQTEKPDVFLFDCVASQYAHLLYLVLREEGVRVIIPGLVGVEDLFYLCENPYFQYDEIWQLFRRMKEGQERPSAEERQWAAAFIERIRSGDKPYINPALGLEEQKFALPGPGAALRIARYLKNYALYDRKDPTLPNPVERAASIFRLRRNRKKAVAFFRSMDDVPRDFVFFPLHFEPEIATLMLSQYDQRSFIDLVVRQLPLSWRFVVKEHPAMVGQRPWQFYEEMTRRYPNLMFVDPNITANHLARKARAVVTLSGTTIIETLILQKPVVFTSRARFGGFGLGVLTENLIDFAPAMQEAMACIPSDDDLINMLSALYRKCSRFSFAEPLGNQQVLERDNISKVADAVLAHVAMPAVDTKAAGVAQRQRAG